MRPSTLTRYSLLSALGIALALALAFPLAARKPPARPSEPPDYAVGRVPEAAPFIILQAGDTTWVEVHTSGSNCPGDPTGGHGGEATGGPDGTDPPRSGKRIHGHHVPAYLQLAVLR